MRIKKVLRMRYFSIFITEYKQVSTSFPMKDTNLSFIETVNDERKNLCNIEHTRHRSVSNFAINLVTGLITYNFYQRNHL